MYLLLRIPSHLIEEMKIALALVCRIRFLFVLIFSFQNLIDRTYCNNSVVTFIAINNVSFACSRYPANSTILFFRSAALKAVRYGFPTNPIWRLSTKAAMLSTCLRHRKRARWTDLAWAGSASFGFSCKLYLYKILVKRSPNCRRDKRLNHQNSKGRGGGRDQ